MKLECFVACNRVSLLFVSRKEHINSLPFFIVSFLSRRQNSQNMISQPRPSKRQYRETFSLIKDPSQSTIN
jgi:hypothetical protein